MELTLIVIIIKGVGRKGEIVIRKRIGIEKASRGNVKICIGVRGKRKENERLVREIKNRGRKGKGKEIIIRLGKG